MEWLVGTDKPLFSLKTKLEKNASRYRDHWVCSNTMRKYMGLVTEAVGEKIN
jgi:hypothetical protein